MRKTTLQLILIGLLIMCFSSCYTEKKAQEQVNKANDKYPEVVAKLARDIYPCSEILLPDTITAVHDTIVYIECPEDPLGYKPTTRQPNDYLKGPMDTVHIRGAIRTVRVPVTLPVQVQYITKWYEDSAKLKLGALQVQKLQDQLNKAEQDLTSMTGKRNWFRKYFFIESGILLLLLLLAIWRIYKRATTIKMRSV